MIFKHEIVDAINSINYDLASLSIKVSDLEAKLDMLESRCKQKIKKK